MAMKGTLEQKEDSWSPRNGVTFVMKLLILGSALQMLW